MMITRAVTACQFCKLLSRNDEGEPVCLAFPDGIPDDIFLQGYDHRIKPYPGDGGVMHQLDTDNPESAGLVLLYQNQFDSGFLRPPAATRANVTCG